MKRNFLFAGIFSFFLFCNASDPIVNLVPNPSFETGKCPTSLSQLDYAESWTSANHGTPDYFSARAKFDVGAPKNYSGYQKAADSISYAGIGFFLFPHRRECIQCKLLEKLVKGQSYQLSFKISLADNSTFYMQEMDAALTPKRIHAMGWKAVRCKKDFLIEFKSDTTYKDKINWIIVSQNYIAKGGEQYLTIGWFDKNEQAVEIPDPKKKSSAAEQAYYYIDDVKLVKVK